MKKIFFFLFAAVMTACFISCINEYEYTIETTYGPITYIGTKKPNETRAVGDIVFTDGSATPYSTTLTLTDDQKEKAIAVIYKVDGSHSYGVGLVQASQKEWCLQTAKGYNKIDAIVCTPSGSSGNYTFDSNADTNGSDNLLKIGEAILNPSFTDDTGTAGNYPAFYFAKNYKDQTNSHVSGTRYETDWYLPTVSELNDIRAARDTVNSAFGKCEGTVIGDYSYWSSSQVSNAENSVYTLNFENSTISTADKKLNTKTTLCIRQF